MQEDLMKNPLLFHLYHGRKSPDQNLFEISNLSQYNSRDEIKIEKFDPEKIKQ